jgi:hypothetical protein
VKAAEADFPFCSKRCRLLDLGHWASGAYVIPSSGEDANEDEPPSSGHGDDDE